MPGLPFLVRALSITLPGHRSDYPQQFWFLEYSIEWHGRIGQGDTNSPLPPNTHPGELKASTVQEKVS